MRPCCLQKGIEGCWECEAFPCKEKMFDSVRIRAFLYGNGYMLSI
ncbi:hypothetical protein [Blautia pseudococcoides]|nr:hypothetical protein I5Q86_23745 [Blautia pseudococcoides]